MSTPAGDIESRTVVAKGGALTHEIGEGGDVVVFDQVGNQLLLLNDIGAAVWLLLNGRRSIADIAGVITETLTAEQAQVEADVIAFVESLRGHGVVVLPAMSPGERPAGGNGDDHDGER